MTEIEEKNYLTEDPVVSNQKYYCVSFLKKVSDNETSTIAGIKIRGVYETIDDAKKRGEFLQKIDPYHNIYIGEVGKWCPYEDNPDKAQDFEYMNKDLNKIMKAHKEQMELSKEEHEIRKNDMLEKIRLENEMKKKLNEDNKELILENQYELERLEDENTSKIEKIKEKLNMDKNALDEDKKLINESIKKLKDLENQLDEKISTLNNLNN